MKIENNIWTVQQKGTDLKSIDQEYNENNKDNLIQIELKEYIANLGKVGWVILMTLRRDRNTQKWEIAPYKLGHVWPDWSLI